MPTFLEKDRSLLVGLNEYRLAFERGQKHLEFARILDIARARGGSDPASAMKRLVVLGFVERRQRKDTGVYALAMRRSRASWEYRISSAGREKLESKGASS